MRCDTRVFLLDLILVVIFSACSLSQEVSEVSVIDPKKILVNRFPYAVVVSFSDQFNKQKVSLYPEDETTAINLGDKLKASLFEAVRTAYKDVELAGDSQDKDVSRVIQFSIEESQVVYVDDLLRNDEEDQSLPPLRLAVFAAAISVEAHGDGFDRPSKKTIIRASSRFFRNFERKKESAEFQKAVNMAIQRIAYDVANLLLQGYAEPVKQHAEDDKFSPKKPNYF